MRTTISFLLLLLFSWNAAAQDPRDLERDKAPAKQAEKRLALVIGNGAYQEARQLVNPANDATDMAEALSKLGFDVIVGVNLNLKQMNDKVREFGDKLKVVGGVGLFYYAGHGIQVGGRNYLVPVEADIPREDEVDFKALNLDQVLRKMASANNGLNIVILDACRNNPFARSWSRGDDEGGLAQITAPTGTFIAYATSPDRTASDGQGRNGLYTTELLRVIPNPSLKIEEAFKQVTIGVDRASAGKQVPWTSSSLRGEFYFMSGAAGAELTREKKTPPGGAQPVNPAASAPTQPIVSTPITNVAVSPETAEWNRIKDSRNPMDLSLFVQKYPNSQHTPEAMAKLYAASRNPMLTGGATGSTGADTGATMVDGERRLPMKTALTKQDYNTSMGVMGIGAGVKYVTAFNGGRSQLRVKNSKPEFEFMLNNPSVNVSDVLIVLKLKAKSDTREIQGMQKTFSGFKKEDTVPLVFEELPQPAGATGKLYRVKIAGALSPGEYAVHFSDSAQAMFGVRGITGSGTFFDFGVDK